MESYFALLLLIVPGFIAQKIFKLLNQDKKYNSNLEETISSLIMSIFILGIDVILLISVYGINFISELKLYFNSFHFLLGYTILTITISIAFGLLWNILCPYFLSVINKIRGLSNKNTIKITKNVWDSVFDDGTNHAIYIEKDGKEYTKGFIKELSDFNNSRELFLEGEDLIDRNPELFSNFKGTYINFDQNIKVCEYDLSKLKSL